MRQISITPPDGRPPAALILPKGTWRNYTRQEGSAYSIGVTFYRKGNGFKALLIRGHVSWTSVVTRFCASWKWRLLSRH